MIHTLIKILLPLAAIIAVVLLARYKFHYSLKEDLQLRAPRFTPLIIWVSIAIAWMLVTDWLMNWRGPWDFTAWKEQPLLVSVLRVAAVCFLGPIAEELGFRGLLFRRMTGTGKIHPWLALTILAAVWALAHYTYTTAVIFIIFIEGIILGAALINTRSLIVPIVMHIAWNLYAIW